MPLIRDGIAIAFKRRMRLMSAAFALIAAFFGFVHAWTLRYDVNSDALSYLELSDAIRGHNWHDALNPHWSPLYPAILAAGLAAVNPTPAEESTVAHLLTFGVYLTTIASFGFFVRQLVLTTRQTSGSDFTDGTAPLPEIAVVGLAWVLFLWASLELIGVGTLSPDMAVATVLFLATGLVLKIQRGPDSWATCLALGFVLGIGYMAKTAILPMAFVYLAIAGVLLTRRRSIAKPAVAAGVLLLLISPLVIGLSLRVGRPTIGTSGAWNYSRFANGIGRPVHWQGEPPAAGAPKHPTRQLSHDPAVYEFATPVPGTYPPWRDPMFWFEGIRPHFDLRGTLKTLGNSAKLYVHLLGGVPKGELPVLNQSFVLLLLVLFSTAGRARRTIESLGRLWTVLTPAIAGLAMYALVYTELRYIGAHLVILMAGFLAGLRLRAGPETRRLAFACLAVVVGVWLTSAVYAWHPAFRAVLSACCARDDGQRNGPWMTATAFKERGLGGAPAGYVGSSFRFYWARLAGTRIVAETRDLSLAHTPYADWINLADRSPSQDRQNDVERFWEGDAQTKERTYAAFRKAGATVIAAEAPALFQLPAGWEVLEGTGLVIYPLTLPALTP